MKLRIALLSAFCVLVLLQQTHAREDSAFVGTWFGTQSWAMDNVPPNDLEPIQVPPNRIFTKGVIAPQAATY